MPRHTVGLSGLLRSLPELAPDALTMARGVAELNSRRSNSKESVGHVFQRLAARQPNRVFLRFADQRWSYGQANARVNQYATVLAEHGIGAGSVVGVLATNRPETLLIALAVVKLGAAAGMLNHHQHGEVLEHSLRVLDSDVLVVGTECQDALDSLSPNGIRAHVHMLRASGDPAPEQPDLNALADRAADHDPQVCTRIRADTRAFLIFTSGTTGFPKASPMSHSRWLKAMVGFGKLGIRLRSADTLYCCLPLYHNNALTISLGSVLAAGASLAIGESFSASRFWDDLARVDATAFCYIGEFCRYLLNQPESEADRRHRVRAIIGNGLTPDIWPAFRDRFGIQRIVEFYSASEANTAFINVFNLEATTGVCTFPFAVVDYDPNTGEPISDDRGRLRRMPTGHTGLLLTEVTDRAPYDGYTDPAASRDKLVRNAFRTGDAWLNTGDLVREQGFRHVLFIDRLGDTFRWKGENVATTEVEAVLDQHPDVRQAVVYGVSVPGTGGRAGMAAVTLRPGATFDGASIAAHMVRALPGYAIPLFLRVVDELAHTSTFKVRKAELRDEGYDTHRIRDPIYVLADRARTYLPAYETYPAEVAAGRIRV